MKLHLRLCLASISAALVLGCSRRIVTVSAPKLEVPQPIQEGIFVVTSQRKKEPTVVVGNNSSVSLRLLLNPAEGKPITLDVPPNSEGHVVVPKGHYEAKVFNLDGKVQSTYGSADITEYKSYRTDFQLYAKPRSFHIGEDGLR